MGDQRVALIVGDLEADGVKTDLEMLLVLHSEVSPV